MHSIALCTILHCAQHCIVRSTRAGASSVEGRERRRKQGGGSLPLQSSKGGGSLALSTGSSTAGGVHRRLAQLAHALQLLGMAQMRQRGRGRGRWHEVIGRVSERRGGV